VNALHTRPFRVLLDGRQYTTVLIPGVVLPGRFSTPRAPGSMRRVP
jgi:hypothetical protein